MQWEFIERNVAYRKLHNIRRKKYIESNTGEVQHRKICDTRG